MSKTTRPVSYTVTWINWFGLLVFVCATWFVVNSPIPLSVKLLVVLGAPAAAVVFLESIFVKRTALSRIEPHKRASTSKLCRLFLKAIGLGCSVGVLAFAYSTLPIYRNGTAAHLIDLFRILWLPLLLCTPIYIWVVDGLMAEKEDGYFHVGLLMTAGWQAADMESVKQHILQWAAKGFFLPLFLTFTAEWMAWLQASPTATAAAALWTNPTAEHWFNIYEFLFAFILYVDCAFGTIGFALTLRLFNTHVRSTEPTASGWLVCLICYRPFWDLVGNVYFNYSIGGVGWGAWLADYPIIKIIWSIIILMLSVCYVSCSIQFGIRYSNLSNRGIVTNGPYRWFRHPQYLSKNLTMWFVSVPFISTLGMGDALRASLLLASVNFIYFLRARTEERHLSSDPAYRDYLEFVQENGFFAILCQKTTMLFRKMKSARVG